MSQRTWTSLIKPLFALMIGIPLIHLSHKHADRQRFRGRRSRKRFFLPNPQATKALSLGQQTMVSDLFWIRTVLILPTLHGTVRIPKRDGLSVWCVPCQL